MQPLLAVQTEAGIVHPCRPMRQAPTRFLQSALVVERVLKLEPHFRSLMAAQLADLPAAPAAGPPAPLAAAVAGAAAGAAGAPRKHPFDDAGTGQTYLSRSNAMLSKLPELTCIAAMMTPFVKYSARTGSSNEYCMSLQRPLVRELDAAVTPYLSSLLPGVVTIAKALQCSIWRRLAPAGWLMDDALRPEGMEKPSADFLAKRMLTDEISNAAAVMDPACWSEFELLGGSYDDAESTLYRLYLAPRAELVESAAGAPADAAAAAAVAADTAAKLKIECDAIRAQPKPSKWMADTAWEDKKREMVAAATERSRVKRAAVRAGEPDAVHEGPMEPLRQAFFAEFALLRKDVEAVAHAGVKSKFGMPLDSGNTERYTYWPSVKSSRPILYFLATCGPLVLKAASISNERVNSVLGRIVTKLRCKLAPSTQEMLTLALVTLQQNASSAPEWVALSAKYGSLERADIAEVDEVLAKLMLERESEVSHQACASPCNMSPGGGGGGVA